jgi:hypothetical protein
MITAHAETGGDLSTLTLACLAHLEQEEAMLSATLESLGQVRAALLGRDLAALERALESQSHTARAADELRGRRNQLRYAIADRLGLDPRTVTLQHLADRVQSDDRVRLARCRQRLHSISIQIDRMNRGNAALVQHSVEFLHQFLMSVTGGEPVGDRYRPSGRIERASCGSLFEGRA